MKNVREGGGSYCRVATNQGILEPMEKPVRMEHPTKTFLLRKYLKKTVTEPIPDFFTRTFWWEIK